MKQTQIKTQNDTNNFAFICILFLCSALLVSPRAAIILNREFITIILFKFQPNVHILLSKVLCSRASF